MTPAQLKAKLRPLYDAALTAGIAPTFGIYWQKEWVTGEPLRYACVEFVK